MITNLQIKFLKSLQLKKFRYEHKKYVCEGEKIISELIQYKPNSIDCIYATEEWVQRHSIENIKIQIATQKDINKISSLSTSPQVLALVNMISSKAQFDSQLLYLYLDRISDPGNLGTIIRTADWYGLKEVFLSPNSVDVYNQKVIQACMGSNFRVQCMYINFEDLINQYSFKNIYATSMKGVDINSIEDVRDSLIIMGNESLGVSEDIIRRSSKEISIHSYSSTESLNVSVATGIIMHQLMTKI